jgi:KTSC domain
MARIEHVFKGSARIGRGWYSEDTQTIELEFPDGAHVVYRNVPPTVWADLVASDSPGRYLADVLERYPFRRR